MVRNASLLLALVVLSAVSALALALAAFPSAARPSSSPTPVTRPLVARVSFADRQDLDRLAGQLDVWQVYHSESYLVALLQPDQYVGLLAAGYHIEIDEARTAELNRPRSLLPDQTNGIPGYPCYRTVEETYATAQAIVAAHPNLATWLDVGDSWEKAQNPLNGYDLRVLRLTNSATPGPKSKLFAMASIHAREYAPAELNTRFAEYLVNNYGVDPDVTWLLDYQEVHLMLQSNPDGRKKAETGLLWRKNTNNNYCANTNNRGADLNRNYDFKWGCCGGSSGDPCNIAYRGPSPASEPETQAVQDYVYSQFPDQRPDDLITPAPLTSTGAFIDLHSYGELVKWPWGFTGELAPNDTTMQTLGRKLAYFNNYTPVRSYQYDLTEGTAKDFVYGRLGVAAFTIELGTDLFQDCPTFNNTIVPANQPALLYAAKAARRPYQTPAGPDSLQVTASVTSVVAGLPVTLTAIADDTHYAGGEPTHNIAAARYTIDAPAWIPSAVHYPMAAADGTFDSPVETVRARVNTSGWTPGRHLLFVESQDAAGNWGVPTAVFVWIAPPTYGVMVTPGVDSQLGNPGVTVTYTLRLTNIGNAADTFMLSKSTTIWTTAVPSSVGPLAANAVTDVLVLVYIPSGANGGATEAVTVTATSTGDAARSAAATLTTTANTVYGVTLAPPIASQSGVPGTVVTYTLWVTNTSNTTDTLSLAYTGNTWMVQLPVTKTVRAARAGVDVIMRVAIPVTATNGLTDTVRVIASGTGTSASSLLTSAVVYQIFIPLATKPSQ